VVKAADVIHIVCDGKIVGSGTYSDLRRDGALVDLTVSSGEKRSSAALNVH